LGEKTEKGIERGRWKLLSLVSADGGRGKDPNKTTAKNSGTLFRILPKVLFQFKAKK
jgi:hypothetical protein